MIWSWPLTYITATNLAALRSDRRAPRRFAALLLAAAYALGLSTPCQAGVADVVAADKVSVYRDSDREDWVLTLFPPAAVDWVPPRVEWVNIPVGVVRKPLRALDGRSVGVWQGGLVMAVLRGEESALPVGDPLRLTAEFSVTELCAGPVEVAVAGLNAAGEETVLRVVGEVTDARWRRRHCKAKG
jgi:hypothetical protein